MSSQFDTPVGGLSPREFRRLLAARCDESIRPDEWQRLQEELARSPESRAYYIEYLDLHSSLGWETTARQHVDLLVSESMLSYREAQGEPTRRHASLAWKATMRWVAVGIAASLLAALGVLTWVTGQSPLVAWSSQTTGTHQSPLKQEDLPLRLAPVIGRLSDQSTNCVWYLENQGRKDDRLVRVGDTLRLLKGQLSAVYDRGVLVTMNAPATYEFTSHLSGHLVQGQLRARVEKGAEGFAVKTPQANVVDHGTEFGLSVDGAGNTDVAVFDGEVEVQYDPKHGSRTAVPQHLRMGEGIRVGEVGTASRLVAISNTSFPSHEAPAPQNRPVLISAVRDNIQRAGNWSFYEIVHGGLREDCRACVDRQFHEWNGIDASGMPAYLLGADYVRMFNDDKLDPDFEMYVTVDRPASLLVFFDDRMDPPQWLLDGFENTGDKIGMDVGPYTHSNPPHYKKDFKRGAGPGQSVENVLSIWRRDVPVPTTLRLGATEAKKSKVNMYAVAAIPLEKGKP